MHTAWGSKDLDDTCPTCGLPEAYRADARERINRHQEKELKPGKGTIEGQCIGNEIVYVFVGYRSITTGVGAALPLPRSAVNHGGSYH